MAIKNRRIFAALIGLAGALNNGEKTDSTDQTAAKAILKEDSDEAVAAVHKEKFRVSPGCETCAMPCGNTSDYDMARYYDADEETIALKDAVAARLEQIAAEYNSKKQEKLPETFYKALSFIGYGMGAASYKRLLEELK